ncbi:hypothetical protein OHA84_09655 [Streptomyces sp. NBC_00513]|uniref:hypothetical protein n=1 Tax=unclassified Streptomyces TaxID=2593676 RepID=UPI00224E007C|nr:hypothetical protein [Streptomyces sp. NBC_00424]MCX5076191.1 hypothetical protein [Streptomyces sp. NBC_00424]WUD40760.1 hypothetical protein OHA84_09655 [Streptomyces sp. NBC_00513]
MSGQGHSRRVAWAAAAALLLVPATACTAGATENGVASASSALAPATAIRADGPADPAAAEARIEKNWAAFFDPSVSADRKVEVLQNGDLLKPLLAAVSGHPQAAAVSSEVTGVTFTSPTEAEVTYDLLVSGFPVLSDTKGGAVLEDGVWKVSLTSLCALVKLGGDLAVPGC